MSNSWKEDSDERLTDAIQSGLEGGMPFVKDWVLMALYVDDEGHDCVAFNSHPNAKRVTSLGMLTYGLLVQFAAILKEEE